MPNRDDDLRRLSTLELAVDDLRRSLTVTPSVLPTNVTPKRTVNVDAAEKMIDRIAGSSQFKGEQAAEFKRLAEAGVQDRLRDIARGGEAAATVNVTVAGTGTISVT